MTARPIPHSRPDASSNQPPESPAPDSASIADLNTLLQRPLFFHRVFLQITGDIVAAWVLNEVFYWTRARNQWFDCSLERWAKDYGVKRYALKSAVAQLRRLGLLELKKAGLPLRISYRINLPALCTEIRKVTRALALDYQSSQSAENRKLGCRNLQASAQESAVLPAENYNIGTIHGTRDGKEHTDIILFAQCANGAPKGCAPTSFPPENQTDHSDESTAQVLSGASKVESTPADSAPKERTLPESDFDDPGLLELWDDFVANTHQIGKPLTPQSAKLILSELVLMGKERAKAALRHSIKYRCSVIYEPQNKDKKNKRRTEKKHSTKREVSLPGRFSLTQDQIDTYQANGQLSEKQALYDELNSLWADQVANHADNGRPMTPATHRHAVKQIQDIVARRGISVAIASLRKTLQGGYLRILEETETEELERERDA